MFSTPLAFALMLLSALTLTSALPTTQSSNTPATSLAARDAQAVTFTLIDATQHQWTTAIPSTMEFTRTNVAESIAHIAIDNPGQYPCAFFGVDGAVIVSFPGTEKYVDVGPPETIVGGICGPFKSHE